MTPKEFVKVNSGYGSGNVVDRDYNASLNIRDY